MTTKQLAKLTPEEKRVKIAEVCGWIAVKLDAAIAKKVRINPAHCLVGISPIVAKMDHGKDESKDYNFWLVPDYLNSLDAMHEAEKFCEQPLVFYYHLEDICLTQEERLTSSGLIKLISSTASQRADAFLLTHS